MVSANIEIINDLNEFFQKTMSDKETKNAIRKQGDRFHA